jgi:hypothetical protein
VECAGAAVRHHGYLKSPDRRHIMKRGGYRSPLARKKAITAVAHALLVTTRHVLAAGQPYDEPGEDYFTRRAGPGRQTRRPTAQPEAPGHTPTLAAATRRTPASPTPSRQHRRRLPSHGPFTYQDLWEPGISRSWQLEAPQVWSLRGERSACLREHQLT